MSERTVYRDVADLMAQGVPIDNEAGVGYRMQPGFDLPPLMCTKDEAQALVAALQVLDEHFRDEQGKTLGRLVPAGRVDDCSLNAEPHRLRGLNPSSSDTSPCIGVFDSGSGGLSVLAALRRRLPDASLLYIGDLAYAPYGDRAPADVIDRSQRVVQQLIERGATMVVVACNTATVLGIATLRRRWPAIEFVGVEPGVKPAAAATRNGRIAVMATPATAESARLRFLIDSFAPDVEVIIVPCPGLASAIERDADDDAALREVLATPCAAIRAAGSDTVVLGCTHYPFVAHTIQTLLGNDIELIDTAVAVAERVATVCDNAVRVSPALRVLSTGACTEMTTLLRRCRELDRAEAEALSI